MRPPGAGLDQDLDGPHAVLAGPGALPFADGAGDVRTLQGDLVHEDVRPDR